MNASSNSSKIKFGTDGWRGIIADDFTFPNVRKVTQAIASYLETAYSQDRLVLIGYDTRFLADKFAQTGAEILASRGWKVLLTNRDCPTPVIAYNVRYLNAAAALTFTASHNPPIYCGIKYIPDYAGPATQEITDKIEAYIADAESTPPERNLNVEISYFDPKPEYLEFLYSQLDVERIRSAKLKVNYDALYSTSRGYLDTALEHCGCQVETFHAQRDPLFGGGMPEPTAKYLKGLVEAVKKDKIDLGVATDGDGDRFGIVDEQGNFVSPNNIFLLVTLHLIKNKGKTGAIVRNAATTHLLDKLAAKYGLESYETPVGFKYIGEKMRETKVLIGAEESGGLSILGHIPEKDGILANLLVVEAIAYTGKPLSQLVAEAIKEAGGPVYNQRLDLPLSRKHKAAFMQAFEQNLPQEVAGIKVNKTERQGSGIKFYLAEGNWMLVRPSGTSEPLIRIYSEVNSPEKQNQLGEAMQGLIHRLKETVG